MTILLSFQRNGFIHKAIEMALDKKNTMTTVGYLFSVCNFLLNL